MRLRGMVLICVHLGRFILDVFTEPSSGDAHLKIKPLGFPENAKDVSEMNQVASACTYLYRRQVKLCERLWSQT